VGRLPNFLVVGAEKAGTTTLAGMLRQHREVFMSDPKELRFFSEHNWSRGLGWYERHFEAAGAARAVGEASPAYTWAPRDPEVPDRIRAVLGDAKYIYMVREPVERVVSHYRHAVFNGWVPASTSLEEAIDAVPALVDCSRYATQIERFGATTEPAQWHVVVLEELASDHATVFADICRFLDIDGAQVPALRQENVTDRKRRVGLVGPLADRDRAGVRLLRSLQRTTGWRVGSTVARPEVRPELLSRLDQLFAPEIERLSDFIGRDLNDSWS